MSDAPVERVVARLIRAAEAIALLADGRLEDSARILRELAHDPGNGAHEAAVDSGAHEAPKVNP